MTGRTLGNHIQINGAFYLHCEGPYNNFTSGHFLCSYFLPLPASAHSLAKTHGSLNKSKFHIYGLVVFRTFLKSEFSDENIEFWMACEDYKKVKGSTKLASKASKIYNEFIDVKAPREINIDYRTRERTKRTLLMEPTPTCLNEVQSKVFSLMEKDSYPRFLRSKMYQDIVNRTHFLYLKM
uniref:Regulator of G-protein signaling 8 n=1 Tax=Neogobius melanostomus TaxID=47308 RepID=A0A8C6T8M5_9GOBI